MADDAIDAERAAALRAAAVNRDECANELEAALLQTAALPAPTAEPVNWEASYHQACDDADAYKADAEKRLLKMEQNWRSCQHEIAYLRERLKDTRAAPPERVSEGKECTCWIGRCRDETTGGWAPDRQACAVHGDAALAAARPAVEPREEP
jgi:hypothetical protein